MKYIFSFAIIFFLCFISLAKTNDISMNEATTMLKKFYTEYITTMADSDTKEEVVKSILNKYLTTAAIHQVQKNITQHDYDILINGQYCRKEWISTMKILRPRPNQSIFHVLFEDKINHEQKTIQIKLIKTKDRILIDEIILNGK
jgi:hypothetical protein